MTEPIISVSGLRGVVGDTLTPEVAIRYAAAFAAVAPPGPIVLARDSRPSGRMLAGAINSGLEAVGRSTINAGIVATPTTGVLVRHLGAAGGIQITASHNPSPYNGLKLFSAEGRVIPADLGEQVLQQYRTGRPAWVAHDSLGTGELLIDTQSAHLALVLATVQPERIRKRRFRVLLDSNHGAGGPLGRRLLEELGCRVTILGEETDGQFAHTPEPTAENLAGVCSAVTAAGADIGFCQDPDADRLAVIDAAGRYIGEEYTVALCVEHVLRHARGPIVTNCSSSRMSQDLAERAGVPFFRSAVGEANVVDAMLANGRDLWRRGQRRADRSARGPGPRQFRRHGPAAGRDGRARAAHRGDGRCPAALRDREDQDRAGEGEDPRRAGRAGIAFPRRGRRPPGRAALGLARPLALGPRQQHGADRPGDCRGADGGGSPAAL